MSMQGKEKTQNRRRHTITALRIDRRQHLELAWKRQQGEDELLKLPTSVAAATIVEVRNLAHLDQLVDSAGSAIVLLYCYSKVPGLLPDFWLCHDI